MSSSQSKSASTCSDRFISCLSSSRLHTFGLIEKVSPAMKGRGRKPEHLSRRRKLDLASTALSFVSFGSFDAVVHRSPRLDSVGVRARSWVSNIRSRREELADADVFLFEFPTRYGYMTAQMKVFFDCTGFYGRSRRFPPSQPPLRQQSPCPLFPSTISWQRITVPLPEIKQQIAFYFASFRQL